MHIVLLGRRSSFGPRLFGVRLIPANRAKRQAWSRSSRRYFSHESGAKGCFSVGQVLPGHKNDLQWELNRAGCSLKWKQEEQNELWIGRHDQANSVMMKDPRLVSQDVRGYVHWPGGHQEGWADAFTNLIASTLRMFGYDGVLSIEHEDSLLSAEEGLTKAVQFLNGVVMLEKPGSAWWV